MILGHSASVISANNASHGKNHYHSNRGDWFVCVQSGAKWQNSTESTGPTVNGIRLSVCRLYRGFYSINSWQHNVQSVTVHSRLPSSLARHCMACDAVWTGKQLSTFRSFGNDCPVGTAPHLRTWIFIKTAVNTLNVLLRFKYLSLIWTRLSARFIT